MIPGRQRKTASWAPSRAGNINGGDDAGMVIVAPIIASGPGTSTENDKLGASSVTKADGRKSHKPAGRGFLAGLFSSSAPPSVQPAMKFKLSKSTSPSSIAQQPPAGPMMRVSPALYNDPAFSGDPTHNPHHLGSVPQPAGTPPTLGASYKGDAESSSSSRHAHMPQPLSSSPYGAYTSRPAYPSSVSTSSSSAASTSTSPPSSAPSSSNSHSPGMIPDAPMSRDYLPEKGAKVVLTYIPEYDIIPDDTPVGPPPDYDFLLGPRPPVIRNESAPELFQPEERPAPPARAASTPLDARPPPPSRRMRVRELDKIDELDESSPLGLALHHGGPYEAIKAAQRPPAGASRTLASQYALNSSTPQNGQPRKPSKHSQSVNVAQGGSSFSITPGQVLPPNFQQFYQPSVEPRQEQLFYSNQRVFDQSRTPPQPPYNRPHPHNPPNNSNEQLLYPNQGGFDQSRTLIRPPYNRPHPHNFPNNSNEQLLYPNQRDFAQSSSSPQPPHNRPHPHNLQNNSNVSIHEHPQQPQTEIPNNVPASQLSQSTVQMMFRPASLASEDDFMDAYGGIAEEETPFTLSRYVGNTGPGPDPSPSSVNDPVPINAAPANPAPPQPMQQRAPESSAYFSEPGYTDERDPYRQAEQIAHQNPNTHPPRSNSVPPTNPNAHLPPRSSPAPAMQQNPYLVQGPYAEPWAPDYGPGGFQNLPPREQRQPSRNGMRQENHPNAAQKMPYPAPLVGLLHQQRPAGGQIPNSQQVTPPGSNYAPSVQTSVSSNHRGGMPPHRHLPKQLVMPTPLRTSPQGVPLDTNRQLSPRAVRFNADPQPIQPQPPSASTGMPPVLVSRAQSVPIASEGRNVLRKRTSLAPVPIQSNNSNGAGLTAVSFSANVMQPPPIVASAVSSTRTGPGAKLEKKHPKRVLSKKRHDF